MMILQDNFSIELQYTTYIALGSFDGLHLGHLSLINKTIEIAKNNKAKSMILTFKNHPMNVINKKHIPKVIQPNSSKVSMLEEYGVDILNLMDFNKEFMKISAEDFIKSLLYHYKAKGLVVGFNYKFGYKNSGDIRLLKELSKKMGFELYIMDAVKFQGEIISSTNIRRLISEGNIEKANKMLGRSYDFCGEVTKGKQIGKNILGFPTANLRYDENYILPKQGVYYSLVKYMDKYYKGITNIGYNPTVNGSVLGIETHILEFDKEIYGEKICVSFLERIRDEKKFNSVEELKEQLEKDKNYAINKESTMNK